MCTGKENIKTLTKLLNEKNTKLILEDLLVIQTHRQELQGSLIRHNALEQKSSISGMSSQLQAD